jgi:hypothetical protein
MRSLALAAALAGAAAPAWAARPPAPINPDPMTVSGRFDLPKAGGSPYAGRVKMGQVSLDGAFAQDAKLDPEALKTAVQAAAARSLQNFGYLAPDGAADALTVDLDVLPISVERTDDGARVTAQLRFKAAADACLAQVGEGRFKALERERSGGGRRAFALGASLAMGLALGPGVNTFMPAEFETASAENRRRNAARLVAVGEGVAPAFGEAGLIGFGAMSATQLALADYLRRLGETPACKAAA